MMDGRQTVGISDRMALAAMLLLAVMALFWSGTGSAAPLHAGQDYLLVGAATDQQAPIRACSAEALAQLNDGIEIDPPAGGWSGAPQAVDVFNVFAGEVMITHGDRQVCGHMQDARTRDSRFRAGIGMVVVPKAGSVEPIRVAWEPPLKTRWIPTVRLGAPSPVQQIDTVRLLIRTACVAIALALALSALLGFLTTRGREFLIYALVCVLLVLWQSVLSGLSGYPEPWLPVGRTAPWWLVALSSLRVAVMGWIMWRLCGGPRVLRRSRGWMQALMILLALLALAAPLMPWALLSSVASSLDMLFLLLCVMSFLFGMASLYQRNFKAMEGVAAVLPLLVMELADVAGTRIPVQYRVEVVQLSVTWFLMVSAYSLNRGLGRLRQQRDEMRHLADTDALTGLPNRRAGLRQLEQYMAQARATAQPLSIGFLDIDLFKQINDRYGHDVGDEVLVLVARTLGNGVRNKVDVIRMGGEEFLVLLPGTAADVAAPRLEQIREKVTHNALALKHDALEVTVSIGLAELHAQDGDVAALLRRADNAMYRAKRAGRNRVVDARNELETA
jgi:diguanylate cyclase (GGDEF)-like protein